MGRETVMTPVSWPTNEWPVFNQVTGDMEGWHLESEAVVEGGEGSLVDSNFHSNFKTGYELGPEFVHWRFPVVGNYAVSPKGHNYSLELQSSFANLTGHDGRSAEPLGQTFISRRQTYSYFDFKVDIDISGVKGAEWETGVSVFLDQVCIHPMASTIFGS
jgi:hypothetical protein